jgi:hypothetical protein
LGSLGSGTLDHLAEPGLCLLNLPSSHLRVSTSETTKTTRT